LYYLQVANNQHISPTTKTILINVNCHNHVYTDTRIPIQLVSLLWLTRRGLPPNLPDPRRCITRSPPHILPFCSLLKSCSNVVPTR